MRVATAGVVATVGHPWRYSVAVQRAAEALAGRTVRLVNGVCLDSTRTVHVVDVIRRLAGEVVGVSAVATGRTAAATLKFGSGAVGTFTTTDQPGRGGRVALEIYADGVRIVVSDTGSELHFEDRIERHTANPAAAHEALDRAFIAAVQRPKTSNGLLVEYADGVRSHRLAIALTRAAAAGYPVRLA
jgi:predicted dehydrogenase